MTFESNRLELGPGSGVVAAVGDVALFVASANADRLVEVARAAVAAGSPPGRGFARRLAALLTGDEADSVPDLGAVADAGAGWVVFLYGGVAATIVTADGTDEHLSGTESATWLDRVLPADTGEVLIAPVGADEVGESSFELEAGVVPGGWLRVIPAPLGATTADVAAGPGGVADDVHAVATPPPMPTPPAAEASGPVAAVPSVADHEAPPQPAAEPSSDDVTAEVAASVTSYETAPPRKRAPPAEAFVSFSLDPDGAETREALPIEGTANVTALAAEESGVQVQGIMCSRQHFNRPDALYCSSCGISTVHQTHRLVSGPRPPLGFLVFDDGSTFTLDGDYVLGREPETDASVVEGSARPIVFDDPGGTVSRVHAEIRLVDWDVQLVDRGSTNGTHLWDVSRSAWDQLIPDQSLVVRPGDRGAVGQRTFVYETPHRQ